MIDVIIADDEYIIRERLKKSINWAEFGYCVVGECENGLQAMEMIESKKPRVAILDINMPILSGLELAEHISKNYLNIHIIVLTGYADFNYAKEALKSGVFRYMLKPLNKAEFNQTLIELKEVIEAEDIAARENFSKLHKLKLAQKKIYLYDLLEYLENPTSDPQDILFDNINYVRNNIPYKCNCSIISIDDTKKINEFLKDKNLWLFCLENILTEMARDNFDIICINNLKGQLIACLITDENNFNDRMLKLFESFLSSVKKIMPFNITIGLGEIVENVAFLPRSYRSSKISFAKRLILGCGQIIKFHEPNYGKNEGIDLGLINDIVLSARTGNFENLQNIFTNSFSILKKSDDWYSTLHNLVSSTMIVSEIICNENNIKYGDVWATGISSSEIISECDSSEELLSFLLNKFKLLIHIINRENRKPVSDTISKIIDYIDMNYKNSELGLRNICLAIPSNASHISNQFKKETGININTYITNKRMQEAQRLILEGNMSVEEIAFNIGYTDQYYFSRCYKKYFGVAPSTKFFKNNQN